MMPKIEVYCDPYYFVISYIVCGLIWLSAYRSGCAKNEDQWARFFILSPVTFPFILPYAIFRMASWIHFRAWRQA
jgi:hypothetical protein